MAGGGEGGALRVARARSRAGGDARRRGHHLRPLRGADEEWRPGAAAVRPVVRARLRPARRPLAVPFAPHRGRPALLESEVKTIGIVGGIGPESTIDYYRQLLARAP